MTLEIKIILPRKTRYSWGGWGLLEAGGVPKAGGVKLRLGGGKVVTNYESQAES